MRRLAARLRSAFNIRRFACPTSGFSSFLFHTAKWQQFEFRAWAILSLAEQRPRAKRRNYSTFRMRKMSTLLLARIKPHKGAIVNRKIDLLNRLSIEENQ
jgi:hypothetical protein